MRERQCPKKKDDGGEVARGAGIPAADGEGLVDERD